MGLKSIERANLIQIKEDKRKERLQRLKRIFWSKVVRILLWAGLWLAALEAFWNNESRQPLNLPICESSEDILWLIPQGPKNQDLCHPLYIPNVTENKIPEPIST